MEQVTMQGLQAQVATLEKEKAAARTILEDLERVLRVKRGPHGHDHMTVTPVHMRLVEALEALGIHVPPEAKVVDLKGPMVGKPWDL